MPEWLSVADKKEKLAKRATVIIYDAVIRALKDPKRVYKDPRRAFEEGLDTAEKILSKLNRGTRKELERNIVNPYKEKHSFD